MGTRYLITGGCGFVGSHLADLLLQRGDQVVVLDDLSTGSYDNVAHLNGSPGFRLLVGSVLDVHGDGQQTRCFAHVLDVVDGLARLLDCPDAYGQVVNLGATEEITIEALARRTIELTGSSSTIRFLPYENVYGPGFEDMQRRLPAIDKAAALVQWSPTRDLNAILSDVIEFTRNQVNAS